LKFRVIVRRFTSYGGAEFIGLRFARFLYSHGLLEEVICGRNEVGECPFRVVELGFLKPGRFLKTYSFQRRVVNYLSQASPAINFAFSKVPQCHVFRDGGGTHLGFLKASDRAFPSFKRYLKRISRALNPVNYYNPYLERQIFRTSGKIIAISSMVKDEILRYYSNLSLDRKVEVVPNPVDVENFNREKRRHLRRKGRVFVGVDDRSFTVGFVSSNFWHKGLYLLIEALSFLPERVKLVVAGGRNPDKFLKLASRLGVEKRVRFLGKVKEMELFYSGIDLLAHPSYYDTFANVVTEALAMGVPVVCSSMTGAKDFVEDGVNGFVLKGFSPVEIAEKISEAMDRNWDFETNLPSDKEIFQRYIEIGEQSLRRE